MADEFKNDPIKETAEAQASAKRSLSDILQDEANVKLRNRIFGGIIILLVVIFFGVMVYGVNNLLANEGQHPVESAVDDSISASPQDAEAVLTYLEAKVIEAGAATPAIGIETKYELRGEDDAVTVSGDNANVLTETAKLLLPKALEEVNGKTGNVSADYGENITGSLWRLDSLSPADIAAVTNNFTYYQCTACKETFDEAFTECPKCAAKNTCNKLYRDNYDFNGTLNDTPDVQAFYKPLTASDVAALLTGLNGFEVLDTKVTYANPAFSAASGRTNGRLYNIVFSRNVDLTLQLKGQDAYAAFGEFTLSLKLIKINRFNFTWPTVNLSAEMVVGAKESVLLSASINAPEGTIVHWRSLTPEIVTVDDVGYIQTGDTYGDGTVQAYYELNGEEISADCVIHVRVPVEGVALNRRREKLSVGETAQLKATLEPDNATIAGCQWFTDDPSIATVDGIIIEHEKVLGIFGGKTENIGTITAVSPGTVRIYCLTEDGAWRSSCTVTVE
ncbi:MAG: Ig-like domain-containing protein [Oscillospiraceae bacterium]|jgi:hypothetical protein|nr:Ig-like domain-containing protein [Oscillospiraceae bacterium]